MVPSTTLVVVNASSVRRPWPRRREHAHRDAQRDGDRDGRPRTPAARATSVAGSRCAITSATGSCETIEVPRSPVKRPWR